MVVSTRNKGWRQPQSAQGSKANKDTFLCLAMLRQTQGKVCVCVATPHAKCRAEEPRLPMSGIETIKTYLLAGAFLLHDAQEVCSNVTSKYSRKTILGYLHGFHAAPWGRLRGVWMRLRVRDGVRAHVFSPSTTYL